MAIKRKRITQVGSGAYAIYLPKKWIDAWSREQRARREVDLHLINNNLLIVPVLRRRRFEARVPPDPEHLRLMLLSAYVRGHHETTLRPSGDQPFGESCVAMARSFLRHLDERLLTTVRPHEISFVVPDNAPPAYASGDALLRLMVTKLQEMVTLAAECVESFGTRPEAALHAAQLLASMQEEDLARLYRQALRLVANLELPLGTASEFQFLDLVAAELETMGASCLSVAHVVVAAHGIAPADLHGPRAHVSRRMEPLTDLPAALTSVLRLYGRVFEQAHSLLGRMGAALHARGTDDLLGVMRESRAAASELSSSLYATVQDILRDGRLSPTAYMVYQVRQPASSLLLGLERAAERAVSLTAAQEPAAP